MRCVRPYYYNIRTTITLYIWMVKCLLSLYAYNTRANRCNNQSPAVKSVQFSDTKTYYSGECFNWSVSVRAFIAGNGTYIPNTKIRWEFYYIFWYDCCVIVTCCVLYVWRADQVHYNKGAERMCMELWIELASSFWYYPLANPTHNFIQIIHHFYYIAFCQLLAHMSHVQ